MVNNQADEVIKEFFLNHSKERYQNKLEKSMKGSE